MVISVVVDASVLLPLIFADEDQLRSKQLMRDGFSKARLLCQRLSMIEFGNGILMGVRRKRLTIEQAAEAFSELENLPLGFHEGACLSNLRKIGELGLRRERSFYDAVYLELARAEGAALATFDGPMAEAATAEGIPLWAWTTV